MRGQLSLLTLARSRKYLAGVFLTVQLLVRLCGLHGIGRVQLFQQLGGSLDKVVGLCMASLSALASVSDLLGNDPSQPPLWCSLW